MTGDTTGATAAPTTMRVGPGGCLVAIGVLLFTSSMVTILLNVAIWPGEAELTAPIFCPADKPEAIVVSDTSNPRPGETTVNFTMYCIDENGAFTEIGWWRPMLALWIFHTLVLFVLISVLGFRSRRRRRKATEVPGTTNFPPPPPPPEPVATSPIS